MDTTDIETNAAIVFDRVPGRDYYELRVYSDMLPELARIIRAGARAEKVPYVTFYVHDPVDGSTRPFPPELVGEEEN